MPLGAYLGSLRSLGIYSGTDTCFTNRMRSAHTVSCDLAGPRANIDRPQGAEMVAEGHSCIW